MDIPLLTELQKLQEEKLDKQAKEFKARQQQGQQQGPKFINNSGQRYTKPENSL